MSRKSSAFLSYLEAMRPHQWAKNCLIFLPAIAAHQFGMAMWMGLLWTFISFGACASASYLLNDFWDIEHDRKHPAKKSRPMASGRISKRTGMVLAWVLLAISFGIAARISVEIVGVLLIYLAATISYTVFLKRKVAIDVVLLACLYTLRVLAGSFASGIMISSWFIGFCLFLFFSLALIKRAAELIAHNDDTKPMLAGRGYSRHDLPIVEMLAAASGYISVLVLALYIESPAVLKLYHHPEFLWAACIVLFYWFTRILIITHRGLMNDDPVIFTLRDPTSLLSIVLVFVIMLAGTLN